MPGLTIDSHGINAVAAVASFLDNLLSHAESVKQTASLEPPLDKADFEDLLGQLTRILSPPSNPSEDGADTRKTQHFAIIETAVRDTFKLLVANTSIECPSFVRVWNLFDILSILSDAEQCDPALLFWLVEELLDSQTIAGCRKVFDFLESRRERIVTKHFKQKQLVILRTCNELLRRLSRALDPAFCGRVFIFMFQSFPLGDKSSVNLRGEYHVENVTHFDQDPPTEGSPDKMDVDTDEKASRGNDGNRQQNVEKALDPDALYPIFWSLQESFNQPKKLFDGPHFAAFKAGLESTMATFRSLNSEQSSRSKEKLDKQVEENSGSLRRKRDDDEDEDELAGSFNPKYLTSRDLFSLEMSDLAFRRNILVQALIIMDFLLALSPKSKEKLGAIKTPNKSVLYSDKVLSEEDAKWAAEMKRAIADYLKQGFEGPYFFRMVETVLSRDKNWVRWKIENCPTIELPPISPEAFNETRRSMAKLTATKRLRATPMGSLPLDFLEDDKEVDPLEKFKPKDRHTLPDLESYKRGIADDDFEISMPTNSETKAAAIEGKASKSWRALRIASKFKLAAFDKIDSDDNINVIFEENAAAEQEADSTDANGDAIFPEDFRPIVIVDAAGKLSGLVTYLITQHPGTFARVPSHVTRKASDGESNGKDCFFVDAQRFNMMRDGDQFLTFTESGDWGQGTSRRSVESISEGGKVPVLEMDDGGAQQLKDNGFSARFIFVHPPTSEILAARLKDSGLDEEKVQEAVLAAAKVVEHSATPDFYDSVIESDYKALKSAVFGTVFNSVGNGTKMVAEDDTMEDAPPTDS